MLNFVIKYEILGCQFKNLGIAKMRELQAKRETTVAEQNPWYVGQFIETIKIHRDVHEYTEFHFFNNEIHNNICFVIRTVEEFASTFATLFFIQIVSSSMLICFTVYVLTFVSKQG